MNCLKTKIRTDVGEVIGVLVRDDKGDIVGSNVWKDIGELVGNDVGMSGIFLGRTFG